jgi:hypothetical protein
MRIVLKASIAVAMLLAASPALAQEIVVTAQRRGYASEPMPASARPVINLRRTADYAVQMVRVVGDTRDAPKRREEVYAMVRNAIQLAGKSGVELSTGDYILEPLTLENYTNLPLRGDGRSDTDQATFLVKTKLVPGMDAKTALARITKFVTEVPTVGRAEMETQGDLTLSVVSPDQYRGQIIDLIAADAAASAAKFGPGYGVQVSGLDRPVEWARASLTEVALYLPASYTVRPKD